MKKALIFGAHGQDGMYLTELLLEQGYAVYAFHRERPGRDFSSEILVDSEIKSERLFSIDGSVSDLKLVQSSIIEIAPQEIYYLPSNHELDFSLENYEASRAVNLDGIAAVLDAVAKTDRSARIFYASTSNVFLNTHTTPQNEETPYAPGTLYGFFKSSAMSLVKIYREKQGLFACSGILYNHESPRRREFFLPKKIVSTAVAIKYGKAQTLSLGDIEAVRDWGFAGDFVYAMWQMLQAQNPQDYIIGTGVPHNVEWILNTVFSELKLDWRNHVQTDSSLVRKNDTRELRADITKIKQELGWKPRVSFRDVLIQMIESEKTKYSTNPTTNKKDSSIN